MSQITHREARRLINFKLDQPLEVNSVPVLDAHLHECTECRRYASDLDELENLLRKMKTISNLRSTQLHFSQIMHRSRGKASGSITNIMVTRIASAGMAFVVVAIIAWQIFWNGIAPPSIPYTAIPIPTPSSYLTSANVNFLFPNCEYITYQVLAGDTLDEIVLRFSIPRDTIMEINGMMDENVDPAMQIRIPACDHTPTVTGNAPYFTITTTPQFEPITNTPG